MINQEEILVLVRATPEKSKKYGHTVCVAGINETGIWRRLYPFTIKYGKKGIDFKKKDIITVDLTKADNDKRQESRKVVNYKKTNSLDDKQVLERLLPSLSSIEKLNESKASLGIIKPFLKDIEITVNDTNLYDSQQYFSLTHDFLEKREKIKMPIELRYTFNCKNEKRCKKPHKIILIDWELNELTRNILRRYRDKTVIKEKIREKFFDFMKSRDLYFILGTHFRFGTWMLIGLFYPKKGITAQKGLDQF